MKKLFLFFYLLHFLLFLATGSELKQMTLGSEGELYGFFIAPPHLKKMLESEKNKRLLIPETFDNDEFTITEAYLLEARGGFVLQVRIIPWKAGEIEMEGVDVGELLGVNERIAIDFEPFSVASVRDGYEFFSELMPPLILGGTIYIFFTALLLLFMLLLLFFRKKHFFHTPHFFRRISRFLRQLKTVRKLKALLRSELSDAAFMKGAQSVMREYFASRFSKSFTASSTSELSAFFPHDTPCAEIFLSFFSRADFVRFSHSSLSEGERKARIEKLLFAVRSCEEDENAHF